ncbi:MAG: hypothetical protein AAFU86_00225 [Pseudomonadota bacterium]
MFIGVLLSAAYIFLITAEYDEAWIIASAQQAFSTDALPEVRPVLTTGGLYFLLVGVAAAVDLDPLLAARSLSFASALLLIALLYVHTGRWFASHTERLIVVATCFAAPGTIMLAGLGFGIPLAMCLLICGLLVLTLHDRTPVAHAVIGGVLIGLAVATRWPLLPALPGILLLIVGAREHRAANFKVALIAGATAVACFAACVGLQMLVQGVADSSGANASLAASAHAAGLSTTLFSPPRLLARVTSLMTVFPVSLLVVGVIACACLDAQSGARRFAILLLGMALLITVAFILRSPALLLRYIWPVYFLAALLAGFGFAMLYSRARTAGVPALIHASLLVPITLVFAQIVIAIRVLAIGAATQVNTAGHETLENQFTPLYLQEEEVQLVKYMKDTPADAIFGTLTLPREHSALEISLLTNRIVHDFHLMGEDVTARPDYIITHRFSQLNDAGQAWLNSLGKPIQKIKGYSIYELPDAVNLPESETVILSTQLYRFGPERQLSLTGWD